MSPGSGELPGMVFFIGGVVMELVDAIKSIATKYSRLKSNIQTEAATKNALIRPFIEALGYDCSDPSEVVPEFTADVGTKKGEKVDYAIMKDGKPIMLIEAKWSGEPLNEDKQDQLLRYFSAVSSQRAAADGTIVGILTNGYEYRFYTALDQQNIMDRRPFLKFSIDNVSDLVAKELKKFAKTAFNIDEILSTAEELKYTGVMKDYLGAQLQDPTDEFVEFMTRQVREPGSRFTVNIRVKFKGIVKKSFSQFISDRANDLLDAAKEKQEEQEALASDAAPPEKAQEAVDDKDKVDITQDDIDGHNIVRAILCKTVDVKRVVTRDTTGYRNVFFDGNQRKPLCRFYFKNSAKKVLWAFETSGTGGNWVRHPIGELSDIYGFADKFIAAAESYLKGNYSGKGSRGSSEPSPEE